MSIGPLEVVIVALILLLIVGGRWIPGVARALGTGLHNLREQVSRTPPPEDEVEAGEDAPRPSSAERVEDEEAAKRP
jgi:Sec-independent protein translocase protein TatA